MRDRRLLWRISTKRRKRWTLPYELDVLDPSVGYTVPLATVLASSSGSPGLAVDGEDIFVVEPDDAKVNRVQRSDGGSRTLVQLANTPGFGKPPTIGRIAVDANYVYFVTTGPSVTYQDGQVLRVSRDGGTAETLASGQNTPIALAIAGPYVYWLNEGLDLVDGGAVMRHLR